MTAAARPRRPRPARKPVAGKVAVVTGAGSGIGRALAVELGARGARLAVSDVDDAGLAETAALLDKAGVPVHQQRLDVTDREAFAAYAEAVVGHYGVAHQIYNNAGIAFSRSVLESQWRDYERVLGVDLFGVIHGTQAFLPHLIASGDGHVVNISSLNGYLAQPGMSQYVTAKFGVRGFTETLRGEMLRDRHPVLVTVVHPGGVRTAIADNAVTVGRELGHEETADDRRKRALYNEQLLRMPPEQAAQIVLDGVEAGRPRVRVGRDAVAVDLLVRLFPSAAPRVAVAAERLAERRLARS